MSAAVSQGAYRHHLAPLADDALLGAHVHHRAVQAPARLLDAPRHHEHARLARDALQLLPRAVPAHRRRLAAAAAAAVRAAELAPDPPRPGARAAAHRVPEVDRPVKVRGELLAAGVRALADDAPERAPARVAPQVRLGQQQDVDVLRGGAARDVGEGGERGRPGGAGGRRGRADADGGHARSMLTRSSGCPFHGVE